MHRGPAGLALDLGDPSGRGVHGPEALVAEAQRVEHDEPDHDRVAHEHDGLPRVSLLELAHSGRHAHRDLAEGLPSREVQEVRRRAPALVVGGETRGDLLARQPLPLAQRHLAERRLDLDREPVGLGDHLRGGARPLERARVDRGHALGRQRAGHRLALAETLRGERDVSGAGEPPLARPRGLPMPYDEEPELPHNLPFYRESARDQADGSSGRTTPNWREWGAPTWRPPPPNAPSTHAQPLALRDTPTGSLGACRFNGHFELEQAAERKRAHGAAGCEPARRRDDESRRGDADHEATPVAGTSALGRA